MSENSPIEANIIEAMKKELYYLIRDHCHVYQISDFRQELCLHDSTLIRFAGTPISEVETFISLVKEKGEYFASIISNLAFEYESESVELSHKIVGTIDVQKTVQLRTNHASKSVVCNISSKKLFIPENLLLGHVILGINLLANKFQEDGREGIFKESYSEKHDQLLQHIIDYTAFLLKDRTMIKLVEQYLVNDKNADQLLSLAFQRAQQGKIRERYRPLLSFVRDWKSFSWILDEQEQSLQQALTPYFEQISVDQLYEMWIFYKVLILFEPIRQKNKNLFVSDKHGITVEYHKQKDIGWQIEKNGNTVHIQRYPDIVVRIGEKDAAIIDAKCMRYSELRDEDERQEPAPDRNIVNQMIIYLDYEKKCDLGFVLFADPSIRGDVIVKQGERKILFLNCYPFDRNAPLSLERITTELGKGL